MISILSPVSGVVRINSPVMADALDFKYKSRTWQTPVKIIVARRLKRVDQLQIAGMSGSGARGRNRNPTSSGVDSAFIVVGNCYKVFTHS